MKRSSGEKLYKKRAGKWIGPLFACLALFIIPSAAQQYPGPKPKPIPKPDVADKAEAADEAPPLEVYSPGGLPNEKAISVEPKVVVSVCINEGGITVKGWDRNEVRAYVLGAQVVFNIGQKNKQTGKPASVSLASSGPSKTKAAESEPCISFEQMELNVPRGADIRIKSRGESQITVESVAKARVENAIGDINLSDISGAVEARNFEGDIFIERAAGNISIETGPGDIFAFDASPNEIGDSFRTRSKSGSITMQDVSHAEVEARSISGAIRYSGILEEGGVYSFATTNGSILLSIPQDSSCKVMAAHGFGNFQSDIPLKNVVKSQQKLSALLGNGSAILDILTSSGAIRFKPLKK